MCARSVPSERVRYSLCVIYHAKIKYVDFVVDAEGIRLQAPHNIIIVIIVVIEYMVRSAVVW